VPEIDNADGATSATEQAEKRTEETHRFMRSVRRATRRKYTPEEKIRIVLEGFRREATVNDLCRREGIKPANYFSWTKEFMEAGKERLTASGMATAVPKRNGNTGSADFTTNAARDCDNHDHFVAS
jgi:transposase